MKEPDKPKRGRPPGTTKGTTTKALHLNLPTHIHERIPDTEGTKNKWCRGVIERAVKRLKK